MIHLTLRHRLSVLIETYWNVKDPKPDLESKKAGVLIETYWNVKRCSIEAVFRKQPVLIETYWNVKLVMLRRWVTLALSINRNILECKGGTGVVWL